MRRTPYAEAKEGASDSARFIGNGIYNVVIGAVCVPFEIFYMPVLLVLCKKNNGDPAELANYSGICRTLTGAWRITAGAVTLASTILPAPKEVRQSIARLDEIGSKLTPEPCRVRLFQQPDFKNQPQERGGFNSTVNNTTVNIVGNKRSAINLNNNDIGTISRSRSHSR